MVFPIALFGQVLMPQLADGRRMKESFLPQPGFVQQRLCPVAQGTAQPLADWYAKTHFRPLDQGPWHVPVQHLPQCPLGLTIAQLHGKRLAGHILNNG